MISALAAKLTSATISGYWWLIGNSGFWQRFIQ